MAGNALNWFPICANGKMKLNNKNQNDQRWSIFDHALCVRGYGRHIFRNKIGWAFFLSQQKNNGEEEVGQIRHF